MIDRGGLWKLIIVLMLVINALIDWQQSKNIDIVTNILLEMTE